MRTACRRAAIRCLIRRCIACYAHYVNDGTFRDECLNTHWFDSAGDARRVVEAWRLEYNESRPHRALGEVPPAEFARRFGARPEPADHQTAEDSHRPGTEIRGRSRSPFSQLTTGPENLGRSIGTDRALLRSFLDHCPPSFYAAF